MRPKVIFLNFQKVPILAKKKCVTFFQLFLNFLGRPERIWKKPSAKTKMQKNAKNVKNVFFHVFFKIYFFGPFFCDKTPLRNFAKIAKNRTLFFTICFSKMRLLKRLLKPLNFPKMRRIHVRLFGPFFGTFEKNLQYSPWGLALSKNPDFSMRFYHDFLTPFFSVRKKTFSKNKWNKKKWQKKKWKKPKKWPFKSYPMRP